MDKAQTNGVSPSGSECSRTDALLSIVDAFKCTDTNAAAYSRLFDVLEDVFDFSSVSIHLLEPDGRYVYQAAERARPSDALDFVLKMTKIENTGLSYMKPIFGLEPYKPRDYAGADKVPQYELIAQIFSGEIAKIPLCSDGKVLGVLTLIIDDVPENWFETEKEWFGIIGKCVGTLIGQMLSFRHEQNVAVIQERERISRELHDNLSQLVGTVRLLAGQVVKSAEEDDNPNLLADAIMLQNAASDAYANVRDDMMGLRFIEDDAQALVPTVNEYVERFQRQWGIDAQFNTLHIPEPFIFDPSRGLQLFRIIQEALTNVHRHAEAARATVTLDVQDGMLLVYISDDGIGFVSDSIGKEHLGLRVMRERAAQIGGDLRIASNPGRGTTVYASIPLRLHA